MLSIPSAPLAPLARSQMARTWAPRPQASFWVMAARSGGRLSPMRFSTAAGFISESILFGLRPSARRSPGASVGEPGFARGQGHAGVYRGPAIPMREIFFNRSAISFLAFWFLANLLFAAVPAPAVATHAAVAWQAHIGGFVFGLFAFRWFDPPSLASRGGGRASRAGW